MNENYRPEMPSESGLQSRFVGFRPSSSPSGKSREKPCIRGMAAGSGEVALRQVGCPPDAGQGLPGQCREQTVRCDGVVPAQCERTRQSWPFGPHEGTCQRWRGRDARER